MRIIRLVPLIILLFPLNLFSQLLRDSTITYSYLSDQDSIRNKKTEYLYNSSGPAISMSEYTWSLEKDAWLTSYKSEYGYDIRGNRNLMLSYYPDASKTGWILHAKREKQFNAVGEMILQTDSWWNPGQSIWEPGLKLEISFNDTVNLKTETAYHWEPDQQKWFPDDRFEERSNTAGKLIERTYAMWTSSKQEWNCFCKEEYGWDEAGNNILMVTFRRDGNQYPWTAEYKVESTYNHSGQRLTLVLSRWDEQNQAWEPVSKQAKTYNTHGDIVFSYDYDWNGTQDKWIRRQGEKFQLSYDSNDSLSLSRHFYMNPFDEWSEDRQSEFKYISGVKGDLYININYEWDSHIDHYGWQSVTRYERFIYADGTITYEGWYTSVDGDQQWNCSGKTFSYFSLKTNGIQELYSDMIRIYPNPTDGIVTITGHLKPVDIKVYTIQGQMIQSENRVENSLDISCLPAGIYYLLIQDGNNILKREKIVKR